MTYAIVGTAIFVAGYFFGWFACEHEHNKVLKNIASLFDVEVR